MLLKLILIGIPVALLASLFGCASPVPPAVGTAPASGATAPASGATAPASGATAPVLCSAQGAQFAVGKPASASVVEQARKRSGAQMARLLRPDQVVTMEFSAQRLNLDVNAAGVITRARCG